ncbi:MAG TPA: 1,4-dihydroxy-2-naphthoate polyprenyltransferase [Ignavibacteriaceae bacterium]|nr:1,4-dihydroxy-2-naphthoate polyprenyltransferase [Ignavibacteriaceae bacterium]
MEHSYSKAEIWILASRPKTLFAAFVPIIVGSSLAYAEGQLDIFIALITLICTTLLQIGTNFANDLFDHLRGADNKKRIGPLRVMNSGLVTSKQMKKALVLVFAAAFIFGLVLVDKGGILILVIGLISIAAAIAYTAGPFPLAYNGLGDIASFLFFGVIGTVGTYYLQTGSVTSSALLAAIPVGALVTNIIVVNNYRDVEQDRIAGKNTLAVKLGETFSRYEYIILITCSFIVPLIMYLYYDFSEWLFLPYLTFPIAYKLIVMMYNYTGPQLNKTLELTAKFSALYGLLFALGFIL